MSHLPNMNDPNMMALMSQLMGDPDVLRLLQRPGMMEKLQTIMGNPSDPATMQQFMADPDFVTLFSKLSQLQGGGGGMSAFGGFPSAAPASSASSSSSVVSITSSEQFYSAINGAGGKTVAVDFTASWCGPCKAIAPVFSSLASSYSDRVVFLKVDGDLNRQLVQSLGVTGFPTFHFYQNGKVVEQFSGADKDRLTRLIEQYSVVEEPAAAPSPFQHFPLKENESVRYADIKWDPVEAKMNEYQESLKSSGNSAALDAGEWKEIEKILSQLKDKAKWQNQTFTTVQYASARKLLHWPAAMHGPVLNFWRIFLLHPHAATTLAKEIQGKSAGGQKDILDDLCTAISKADKPVNSLLGIRALCNGFSRRALSKALGSRAEEITDSLTALLANTTDSSLQLAAVCLFINFSILFREDSSYYESGKIQLLSSTGELLRILNGNPRLWYSALVVIGTLLYSDSTIKEMAEGLELIDGIQRVLTASAAAGGENLQDEKQLKEVANEVLKCLQESPEMKQK